MSVIDNVSVVAKGKRLRMKNLGDIVIFSDKDYEDTNTILQGVERGLAGDLSEYYDTQDKFNADINTVDMELSKDRGAITLAQSGGYIVDVKESIKCVRLTMNGSHVRSFICKTNIENLEDTGKAEEYKFEDVTHDYRKTSKEVSQVALLRIIKVYNRIMDKKVAEFNKATGNVDFNFDGLETQCSVKYAKILYLVLSEVFDFVQRKDTKQLGVFILQFDTAGASEDVFRRAINEVCDLLDDYKDRVQIFLDITDNELYNKIDYGMFSVTK